MMETEVVKLSNENLINEAVVIKKLFSYINERVKKIEVELSFFKDQSTNFLDNPEGMEYLIAYKEGKVVAYHHILKKVTEFLEDELNSIKEE